MFTLIDRIPDAVLVHTETELLHFQGDKEIAQNDLQISFKIADIASASPLKIYVKADTTPLKYIRLRWKMPVSKTARLLSDCWERSYGDMGWENISPFQACPWYFLLKQDSELAGYGVKVRPGALCFWQMDPQGISLWLDVRNGGSGVLLNGRTLLAAEIISAVFRLDETSENAFTSFHAAREFCKLMCTDPILPPHAVYGANNWYYAYGHSSREEILADTDYLMSLTAEAENPPYMVIDDCWQRDRQDDYIGGPWTSNEKFGDMKTLADAIKEKGARPGIWVRLLFDHREELPTEWRLESGYLDPSHPGVLAKITEEVQRIGSWGYTLLKHDFTTFDIFGKWGWQMNPLMTDDGWHFHNRTLTSAEIIKNLYETILNAGKPYNMLILGCNTIGHLGAGLMHMNRVGDDTSGRIWERSLRMGVNALAFRLPQHRTFFDIDADCIGIMETLPWKQNKVWGELLAKSGTSLFVSAKPGVLTEDEKKELGDFLMTNSRQDQTAVPLDWEYTSYPEDWELQEKTVHLDYDYEDGPIALQGKIRSFELEHLFKITDYRW